ncbi:MAG: guanylate cyclase [Treponema sp.]|nr:guanylate cyclase [Treponema sp.]
MKKILILENSVTIQKLFTTTLDEEEYSLRFTSDGKSAIYALFDFQPDLFLLNADSENPGSFETVKLLRAIPCFKNLTIGMYTPSPFPLDKDFARESGVSAFVELEEKTLLLNIEELALLSIQKLDKKELSKTKKDLDDTRLFLESTKIVKSESLKLVSLARINGMMKKIEAIEDMAADFLSLVAEFTEVPAAGLYIVENDGPHGYYISAEGMSEHDTENFLAVCASDFEDLLPDYNISKIVPKRLSAVPPLDKFYSEDAKLSSYEAAEIRSVNNVTGRASIGSLHIVSEGNLTVQQLDFFNYCAKHAGVMFDKAIVVKKKMFFEKRIRRAFSRFVPDEVIDDLVASSDTDEKIGVGEKRAIAILFSDIRSFTNISERNKPETVVAFLNRYFTIMVDIIKKHGGTIDKFIGDAIMALFGTPVSYEDNARRAVAAASEMRDALPSVPLEDLVLPEGMTFNIGIGIHYGDVIVGSIGSKDKTDYSVIGDNVNLASRLEGLTKTYGTQVLVSEAVRDDTGSGAFSYRHLDDVRVKGKAKAVPIFAVDRSDDEFPAAYKDAYVKGMELYKQGIWNLAHDYFEKALGAVKDDKAAKLMLSRCAEFMENPPEHWDGAIAFTTK